MLNPPQTLKEARAYRYNKWSGNPEGDHYSEGYCAYEMYGVLLQCNIYPKHGAGGLYCSRHARMVEGEKDE